MDTAIAWAEIAASAGAGFLVGGPIGAIGVGSLAFLMAMMNGQNGSGMPWWGWALIGVTVLAVGGFVGWRLAS